MKLRTGSSLLAILALTLTAAGSGPALAGGGTANSPYYYFSQPGIARAQVLADFEECRDLASMVRPPSSSDLAYVPTQGVAGAATLGLLQGLERGERHRNMAGAAYRRCMAIKGYKRLAMSKDEAKVLYAGGWEIQRERMVDAALAPVGEHLRLDP
jgi:hypothetical protein